MDEAQAALPSAQDGLFHTMHQSGLEHPHGLYDGVELLVRERRHAGQRQHLL